MKKIQYDGFELEHFDSALSFRLYQFSLIKKYLVKNFLEVGAGKGGLTSIYKNHIKNITLLEPDIKLFKYLKKKFKKDNIVIKNHQIKDIKDTFDTIVYFDVIEHIKDDLNEVKTASNRLNRNGHLIISVPAFQIFYSDFDKSVGHFKRYSKRDLKEIEKNCELRIEKLIYYDSIGFLLLLINKFFSLKSRNLKFKIFIWNLLIPISKILDLLTFNKFGKSLLCVFKKV